MTFRESKNSKSTTKANKPTATTAAVIRSLQQCDITGFTEEKARDLDLDFIDSLKDLEAQTIARVIWAFHEDEFGEETTIQEATTTHEMIKKIFSMNLTGSQ